MSILKDKDYVLLEQLVSLKQYEVHKIMERYLKSKFDNVIATTEYIVAIGNIPIALVAHMDTVFKHPVCDLYYDSKKEVLWSPEGLGADDRAGVFAIIKILQSGLKPSIILTTDEEKGGIGAIALATKECPIPNLKYMIELDRRGINDCVFYDCYCPEFIDYVQSFGFQEQLGSFSDISFLMSEWRICGVNLSVGYDNEHSTSEILNIVALYDTINKVKLMLQEEEIPSFLYDEICQAEKMMRGQIIFGQHCCHCKKLFSEYELIPVKDINDKTKYYCPDCIVNNVDWCDVCGEPFELYDPAIKNLCKKCAEESCTKTSKNNSKK